MVFAYFGEGPARLLAFPSLELSDRLRGKKIFECGQEELVPVLSARFQLLEEFNRRRVDRDARETIRRRAHVQSIDSMNIMYAHSLGGKPLSVLDHGHWSAFWSGFSQVRVRVGARCITLFSGSWQSEPSARSSERGGFVRGERHLIVLAGTPRAPRGLDIDRARFAAGL
jgi:hypothetical protein